MNPLSPTALDHAHYVRLSLVANVPTGTSLEDVTTPAYWANHAYRLKRGALIEVLSEDNELDCVLRVLEVGPTFAKVRVLNIFAQPKAVKAAKHKDEVEVTYGGKNDRWRVLHLGEVVSSGHETRSAAEKAAEDYKGKLAA